MTIKNCDNCGEEIKARFIKEGEEIPTFIVTTKGTFCDKCRKELQKTGSE